MQRDPTVFDYVFAIGALIVAMNPLNVSVTEPFEQAYRNIRIVMAVELDLSGIVRDIVRTDDLFVSEDEVFVETCDCVGWNA